MGRVPDAANSLSHPPANEAAAEDARRPGEDGRFSSAVSAMVTIFGDPTRRDIYLFVRSHPGTTAGEVADHFSLHPNVARHHLDRLVSGGYLEVEVGHRKAASGKSGRGVGRPSKRFRAIGDDPTIGLLTRRDELLVRLLREALDLLGPERSEEMAAKVGEEYGLSLASRMGAREGQRSVRAAMHAIAETLSAHGFAAHAEDHGNTTAVVAEQCPFGDAATTHPVLCAVDRGMVNGLLAGLCGESPEGATPVLLSSRARGDATCAASA